MRSVADEFVNDTVQTELKEVAMESIMTARQINRILQTEGPVQNIEILRLESPSGRYFESLLGTIRLYLNRFRN